MAKRRTELQQILRLADLVHPRKLRRGTKRRLGPPVASALLTWDSSASSVLVFAFLRRRPDSDPSVVIGRAPDLLEHSVDAALDVLARRALPTDLLVSHEFPLEGYREAIQAGLDKKTSRAIKVTFRPNG